MRSNGILCSIRRSYRNTTNSNHGYPKYPNLIKNLIPVRLNQVWHADITYIRFLSFFAYLAAIHEAVARVSRAVVENKTMVIDLDLESYFDNIKHGILLSKVAQRVDDDRIMRLLKMILKANGKRGVPQGGVISPLLANIYLNEVDKMLEKAKKVTKQGEYTYIQYARFADDIVILVNYYYKWLAKAVYKRTVQELDKLGVKVNRDKTKIADLTKGEAFSFLGFVYRGVSIVPKVKARTALLRNLKEIFKRYRSQPLSRVVELINPILRGWTNYFRIGNSSECFAYVKDWVEKKIRRHLMRVRKRHGFGWNRWSRDWLYNTLGLYNDCRVRYCCA